MTVYATRLVNGTDSMERMRRTDAVGLFASGPGTAQPGFRNDGGAAVTVNAGTMTVDVAPFMAYVDGGVSDTQGGYTFVSDATETLTISPGHASLSRTDVVIAEVRDTVHDGSGSTDARVRILEGTPGAGVPALPTNALALRELNIPAGLSAGTGGLASGNLGTDRRTYTTGLGGTLTVASQAERDALPQINGTEVYRSDLDRLQVRTAAGWIDVLQGSMDGWTAYTPTWTATGAQPSIGNGTLLGRYTVLGKTVHWRMYFVVGSSSTGGSGRWDFALPVPENTNALGAWMPMGTGIAVDTGIRAYGGIMNWVSAGKVTYWRDGGPSEATITTTTPFAWQTGDYLFASGTYERA